MMYDTGCARCGSMEITLCVEPVIYTEWCRDCRYTLHTPVDPQPEYECLYCGAELAEYEYQQTSFWKNKPCILQLRYECDCEQPTTEGGK
jgi:hypothetical protein